MGPYMEAAGPLLAAAGIEVMTLGKPILENGIQVLEGKRPYDGTLTLYRSPSMESLLEFWNSPEYQDAIKLREGIVESNFTAAIEPPG